MSSRNREEKSRVECQESRASTALATPHSPLRIPHFALGNPQSAIRNRSRRPARRGVLLLVVLSLLVLFMLLGTAYLMSSSQYGKAAKASGKNNRVGSPPTKLLDSALMQILRDTGEPSSVIRYHSLLRDMYGTDGIEAEVRGATYARDFASDNLPLGRTQGQLIDIYVIPSLGAAAPLDAMHVIRLDRDPNGQPQLLNPAQPAAPRLPLTKGYYNGCLLTITSGPAAGQSTRIVDFEYVGGDTAITSRFPNLPDRPSAAAINNTWRFRVMAFPRADGNPLALNTEPIPGIADLALTRFIINGRPFNGTGVGYNPMAPAGTPRLNAVERIPIHSANPIFSEVALTPNSVHVLLADPTQSSTDDYGIGFLLNPTTFRSLNPKAVAPAQRATQWKYPSFVGTGDADESYDAADYQNMALALQTVLPRPRGRVVHGNAANPNVYEADFQNDIDNQAVFNNGSSQFLRLDLEDLPLPSFHRPDLINFWFHRLAQYAADPASPLTATFSDEHVRAVLQPYGPDGIRGNADDPGVDLAIRDQIVAIKRRISMRPLREDHPNFDGSNPQSRPANLSGVNGFARGTAPNQQIAVPFWEAVGPWDVDNDNDGVPDSVWVDLGDPVVQAEDGTLYKPLYAFLILDMDSRLNVNAHGLVEHLQAPPLDATGNSLAGLDSSDFLPHGIGYGPAEISLRPVLSRNLPGSAFSANVGDPTLVQNADDFARLQLGRPPSTTSPPVWGRYGLLTLRGGAANVHPGIPYNYVTADPLEQVASIDRLSFMKFIGYPWWLSNYFGGTPAVSAFSSVPDLMGRYSLGLDHVGQPIVEARADFTAYGQRPLLFDSPYELNLSDSVRRDTPHSSVASAIQALPTAPINDDAPFATSDLERLLRAFDADSGLLPDRLWSLVDAFDPLKLYNPTTGGNQPAAVQALAMELFGSTSNPQQLAAAQQMAAISRRLVTTDSYDLPVPSQNMPNWATAAGPAGAPGVAGVDDNGNGVVDDPTELGWRDDAFQRSSDDFEAVTGQQLSRASIVNLLHYRVFLDQRKKHIQSEGWAEPLTAQQNYTVRVAADAIMNGAPAAGIPPLAEQLLAPEVIAGRRMDLNRPFGDGRDNHNLGQPGYGVVDDPLEAGEPFLDLNGNGKWDHGEPFIDLNANGSYDGPLDQLWPELTASGALGEPIAFDYTNGYGEPLHPDAGTFPSTARVRNLNSQGRQLFARHLYCLMMLLMDEHYLEMPDLPSLEGNNLNLEIQLMDTAVANGGSAFASTDADKLQVRRKLTAKRIAQWAINVVDFRDADSIMTAFEYDENPWDGWGCLDANGVNIPLDGDVGTDENMGQVIDWQNVEPRNGANPPVKPAITVPVPALAERTRGVVWGTERPELLITETLAFHDRRCTDEPENGSVANFNPMAPPEQRDYDLDQRLKPRGSLFVELYNPWTKDGNRPAEFYGQVTTNPSEPENSRGVMLNRLSDIADPVSGKFSPVWRMSVLRDPLNGRMPVFKNLAKELDSGVLDMTSFAAPDATDQESISADFLTIDPDGYGIDMDWAAERHVYFTTGRNYSTDTGSDPDRSNNDNSLDEGGTLGEWSFAGGTPVPVVSQLSVWVPPLPQPRQVVVAGQTHIVPRAKRYFIARNERVPSGLANDRDVTIAPILPGRYAVVGSSGLQLVGLGATTARAEDGEVAQRFVTPISRQAVQTEDVNGDKLIFGPGVAGLLPEMRRIELWPNPQGRPDIHQVLVAENGGPEFVRINSNTVINATDHDLTGNPTTTPAQLLIDPAVAIPVEDLNISEPVDGYPSITYRRLYEMNTPVTSNNLQVPFPEYQLRLTEHGDQEFWDPFSGTEPKFYDRPLDTDFELVRNGTTQNYRSIHLQRLANPTLPWNPPAVDLAGNAHPMHRPWLPVNPYRTIDSQSTDLTAFNGASTLERTNLPVNMQFSENLVTDKLQANIIAPITAAQFLDAPDHEIWAMMLLLRLKTGAILGNSPEEVRAIGETQNGLELIEDRLSSLEALEDQATRASLTAMVQENVPPGQTAKYPNGMTQGWHWHMYKRVLPDDQVPGAPMNDFRQWMHFKSLERGYHASVYYKYPKPGIFYNANPASLEGWAPDLSVIPRTLWKQERPNARLFLQGPSGIVDASDLKNVTSYRVMSHTGGNPKLTNEELTRTIPDSVIRRNELIYNQLAASAAPSPQPHAIFDYVLEQTLGFANRSFTPDLERADTQHATTMLGAPRRGAPQVALSGSAIAPRDPSNAPPGVEDKEIWNAQRQASHLNGPNPPTPQPSLLQDVVDDTMMPPAQKDDLVSDLVDEFYERRRALTRSTFPWLTWNDRPFTSAEEVMHVPGASSSLTLRDYSLPNYFTANPYDGNRNFGVVAVPPWKTPTQILAMQGSPFGHLLNFFASTALPAVVITDPKEPTGSPNYHRILDFVEVPSRYVGTETLLTPEVFNDPGGANNLVGTPITGPNDPRYKLQPPFNKVSRQRDPGKVNLNTVVGRRGINPRTGLLQIWSDVYDGIMHRYGDDSLFSGANLLQLSHFGPAWRDVAISRRGYAQFNADASATPVDKVAGVPDTFTFGLNKDFPSFFSNPFRSADAGDLVPLGQLQQYGVDATWLRVHPYRRGDDRRYGPPTNPPFGDIRDAGFGSDDELSIRAGIGPAPPGAIPAVDFSERDAIPLFSETRSDPSIDAHRNPGMMYQPMTRLGNLVTTRSNVYAIWVTVGYFEVEPAPPFADVSAKFGGNNAAGRAMYDRVYPEGYALGQEVGIDVGNTKRHRAFYIIDRTEPVGFKPGEDLNVENMIRVRRRIE